MSGVANVSSWARFAGLSVRPWSGRSPLALIVRGLIGVGVAVFLVAISRGFAAVLGEMAGQVGGGVTSRDLAPLGVFGFIAAVVVGVPALGMLVVGVLDAVPRRSVVGTVLSVSERRFGDFLPILAQRLVWERNRHGGSGIDRRRTRTEVVLLTDAGELAFTVRSGRHREVLRVGRAVRLSVSPIAGYVASASAN